MLLSFFCHCDKNPGEQLTEKALTPIHGIEGLLYGQLAPLLCACCGAKHHIRKSYVTRIVEVEREREQPCPSKLLPPIRPTVLTLLMQEEYSGSVRLSMPTRECRLNYGASCF